MRISSIETKLGLPRIYVPRDGSLRLYLGQRAEDKIYDLSYFKNHGTIYGAVWKTLASGLNILKFDGEDDYVGCGNDESLDITDIITLKLWIKRISGNNQIAVSKGAYKEDGWYLWASSSSSPYHFGVMVNKSGEKEYISAEQFIPYLKWQHIVVVLDNVNLIAKFFVNGEKIRETSYSFAFTGNVNRNLYMGCYDPSFSNYWTNGYIAIPCVCAEGWSSKKVKENFELERVIFGV